MSRDLTNRDVMVTKVPHISRSDEPSSPECAAGPSLLIRFVPVGLVVSMLALVTHQALNPLADPDIWWHLRMGDELRDGWNFSQTQGWTPFATADWVRTQWLPEVVQSWMNSTFGLAGVAWLFGVSLMVIVAVLYLVCRRQAGTLAAAVATAVGFIGMSATLTPRPQLVSFVLVLVFVGAWLQTAQDLRPRWWLIALTWIWACSHGMWLVGPVVGLTVTAGLVLDRRLRRGQAAQLFLVSLLGFVAAGLTPVGPELLRTPFAVGGISGFITEWAPPSIRDLAPAATFAVFAFIVLMWTRGKRVPWTHVALFVLALGWALLSARTVTLGAAIVAPLFAGSLQKLLPGARARVNRPEIAALGVAGLVCAIVLTLVVASTSSVPGSVPLKLDARLDGLPPKTVILNSYDVGGWLLWRHPTLAPIVDGRTEAFPVSYLADYVRTVQVTNGWQGRVKSTGARWALLEAGSPLATALIERLRWKSVGSDKGYVLLEDGSRLPLEPARP
jgi:hypothetical protein